MEVADSDKEFLEQRPPSYNTARRHQSYQFANSSDSEDDLSRESQNEPHTCWETSTVLLNYVLFDVVIHAIEALAIAALGRMLYLKGFTSIAVGIFTVYAISCVAVSLTWLVRINRQGRSCGMWFGLLLGTFPWPLFGYLHTLYRVLKDTDTTIQATLACNHLRLVHAISSAIILLMNLATLLSILESDQSIDFRGLHDHNVKLHVLAALLSLISLVRALTLYNERRSFTILLFAIGIPFTLTTVLPRALGLALIAAFMPWCWTVAIFFGLGLSNLLLYKCCGKKDLTQAIGNHNIELKSTTDWWTTFPKYVYWSTWSIFCPSGYSNDRALGHARIKGGLFILLNFLVNQFAIAIALGCTIYFYIPNSIHGLELSQPDLEVELSGSTIKLDIGGMVVSMALPVQALNLGSMPAIDATFNTDQSDVIHAIALPAFLIVLSLPYAIMRAAMMELDCVVARRKLLDAKTDQTAETRFGDIYRTNSQGRGFRARLCLTIMCSAFGLCAFVFIMIGGTGVILSQLH